MSILEGGGLSGRVGRAPLMLFPLTRGSSFCDCCAATYNMRSYETFYGIDVSEENPLIKDFGVDVTTDVVTLPDGSTLYVTLATEAFEEGDGDDY